jgi:trypsin
VVDVTQSMLKFSTRDAGPCMGDSGGPQLAGNTVLSLTSGGPKDCTGRSDGYRVDTASARCFLGRFVTLP